MKKFTKIIFQNIQSADVIIELLDARDPMGTRNKEIEDYIVKNEKILILVLNKADLVPKHINEKWKVLLEKEFPTMYVGFTKEYEVSSHILKNLILKYSSKFDADIRVLIMGYPNTGKSSIINSLKKKKTVGISPDAGFTKGKQYIRLTDNILLIDSPGVFPLDDADEVDLVLKDAIRVERVKDPCFVIDELFRRIDTKILKDVYGFDFTDSDDFMEKFARKHGKLLPGNEPNVDEAARMIIRDWQRGKIHYYFPPPE